MALVVSLCTPINEALWLLQRLLRHRQIKATPLQQPPLFILGHWRSGTTLLHELMVLEPSRSSPSTYQCFAPHHFLVSEWAFTRFGNWLLPSKRPMDNMTAGWERPQEDEFALMNLGLPSPYRWLAFPNNDPPDLNYLDWQQISAAEEQRWVDRLRYFLQAVTYRTGKPLVLKSPTHTGRIRLLAKSFPGAKFVHITRDPRSLFPSTCRLWHSLVEVQAFQKVDPARVRPYVVACLQRMYRAFHAGVAELPADQVMQVRYEDLVADPVACVKSIYQHLDLKGFEQLEPLLQQWVTDHHRGYQANRHALPPEDEAMIREAWSDYFERYGYA
jgi:LPS sulfotransferase NodH